MARRLYLGWAAVSLAGLGGALAGLTIDRSGTVAAAGANGRALWPLWIASASGWTALTALWVHLRGRHEAWDRRGAAIVLLVAAAARLAVLLLHQPGLSDDIYRYVFDGRNLAAGVNPYLVTPASRAEATTAAWPGEPAIAGRCNNPDKHTIYLPASQLAFAAIEVATPATADPEGATWPFRAAFTAVDLAIVILLLACLRAAGRSAWWACLYAWHPLPVIEIAGSGHQDVLGVLGLVAALMIGTRGLRRTAAWTAWLASASLVKPVVLPAAPMLLRHERPAVWARSAALGVAICVAVSAPLLLTHGGEPLANLLATVDVFRLKWAHFGGVYEGLLTVIEWLTPGWTNDPQEVLARRTCSACLLAILVVLWWRSASVRGVPHSGGGGAWAATGAALIAMVALSPTAHPWYLLWALALVPLAPGPVTWTASLTITWGYAAWAYVGDDGAAQWGVPAWLLWAAWGPVVGVAAWRVWVGWCHDRSRAPRRTDRAA